MTAGAAPISLDPPECVSVIIPLYNRAGLIGEAIDSVFAQTWPAVDIIVVDDGSTDGGAETVEAIAANHDNVRLLRRPNGGPGAARNTGLADVRTRLVTFLDSDDLMRPDRLETQIAYLADHPDRDMVIGTEEVVVEGDAELPVLVQAQIARSNGPLWYATSVMIEHAWLERVHGFDEIHHLGEDVDLVMRLLEAGATMGRIDHVMVTRRIHGDNLVYDADQGRAALFHSLKRHLDFTRQNGTDEPVTGRS